MKIRTDYISNSSSSSFIVTNPKCLIEKNDALVLFQKAEYISFTINVDDFGEDELIKFKQFLNDLFENAVEFDSFNEEQCEIILNKSDGYRNEYNWYDKLTKEKIKIINELLYKCDEVCLNFGDAYMDESNDKTNQVANLLDFMFGANIIGEDHFDYEPIFYHDCVKEKSG